MAKSGSGKGTETGPKQRVQGHRFPALLPGAVGMLILLISVFPTAGDIHKHYYARIMPAVVLVLSIIMITLAVRCRRWVWVLPFVLVVAFFNPTYLLRLDAGAEMGWQVADILAATCFLLGAYFIYPKSWTKTEDGTSGTKKS